MIEKIDSILQMDSTTLKADHCLLAAVLINKVNVVEHLVSQYGYDDHTLAVAISNLQPTGQSKILSLLQDAKQHTEQRTIVGVQPEGLMRRIYGKSMVWTDSGTGSWIIVLSIVVVTMGWIFYG